MNDRKCIKCKELRPISYFTPYGKGRRRVCDECTSAKAGSGEKSHLPTLVHSGTALAAPRNSSPAEKYYQILFKAQDGKCEICHNSEIARNENGEVLRLSIYGANHYGTVRKCLLCKLCSTGLSMFRDSPALLAQAIAFLTSTARSSKELEIRTHP